MTNYVVISYQPDYEIRCPRGCCTDASGSSSFGMAKFDKLEQVADYIAPIIDSDKHAQNQFLVFDRWENLIDFASNYQECINTGTTGIVCPWKYEDYDEAQRLGQKEDNLRRMVRDRLTAMNEARKLKESEERAKQEEDRLARQQADKLAEYNRLKAEFEGETKS